MTFKDWCISNKDKVKQQFRQIMGYDLDLENPRTISEKLNWLKVYDSIFLKTLCSDKLKVRDYVKEKLGEYLFLPVLGVYDKFDEIDFTKLPKDYVIKCNHGSGMNIIVKDGNIDKITAKRKLENWMQTDYLHLYEFFYKPIEKKFFIEQYKENKGKNSLTDYKFSCFNGEPKICQVMNDRFTDKLHFNYYDNLFNPLKSISRKDHPANYNELDKKPSSWNIMLEYSKILSKDFKFVRVDFYEIDGKPYLSELTFLPNGGYLKYTNNQIDLELGKLLKI